MCVGSLPWLIPFARLALLKMDSLWGVMISSDSLSDLPTGLCPPSLRIGGELCLLREGWIGGDLGLLGGVLDLLFPQIERLLPPGGDPLCLTGVQGLFWLAGAGECGILTFV